MRVDDMEREVDRYCKCLPPPVDDEVSQKQFEVSGVMGKPMKDRLDKIIRGSRGRP